MNSVNNSIEMYGNIYPHKNSKELTKIMAYLSAMKIPQGELYFKKYFVPLFTKDDKIGVFRDLDFNFFSANISSKTEPDKIDTFHATYTIDESSIKALSSIEEITNILGELENSKLKEYNEVLEYQEKQLDRSSIYYEFEALQKSDSCSSFDSKKVISLYTEIKDDWYDNGLTVEAKSNLIMIYFGSSFLELNPKKDDAIKELIANLLVSNLDISNKIKKIKNGYIFEDTYFENREDLVEEVAKKITVDKYCN